MSSTIVITIPDGERTTDHLKEKKKFQCLSLFSPVISFVKERRLSKDDTRKVVHSLKVGTALVLVSLLYLLDPLYREVGDDNAMWAIMTIIVVFEFHAGATLSKGLNRGMGTIVGGGLGFLAATLGQQVGGIGNSIIVGVSVFVFGGAATYSRMIPSVKRRYDYGTMIFILTFNLVAVSGSRSKDVMEIARERLLMIVIGFLICIFTSLFVFPIWASDELHDSTVSKFENLATSIDGALQEFFETVRVVKENQPAVQPISSFSGCKSVLNSKSKDDTLANFARWEPWHGKFGFTYPWDKYQKIGETLRELAATILSLEGCLHSSRRVCQNVRESIKKPCEAMGSLLAWTLRELGDGINRMRRCQPESSIVPKLKSVRLELSRVMTTSELDELENAEALAMASFVFSLMEMVDKLEKLAKEVGELGEFAGFPEN